MSSEEMVTRQGDENNDLFGEIQEEITYLEGEDMYTKHLEKENASLKIEVILYRAFQRVLDNMLTD